MIEEPGSTSGSTISARPVCGPDASRRRSMQSFVTSTAMPLTGSKREIFSTISSRHSAVSSAGRAVMPRSEWTGRTTTSSRPLPSREIGTSTVGHCHAILISPWRSSASITIASSSRKRERRSRVRVAGTMRASFRGRPVHSNRHRLIPSTRFARETAISVSAGHPGSGPANRTGCS